MKTFILLLVIVWLLPVTVFGQTISTYAGGGFGGDGSLATAARIINPNIGVFDKYGNYYFPELVGNRVRKIDTSGHVTTLAGNGTGGFSGDGGPASVAQLKNPCSVVLDSLGNIYVAEVNNNRVRKIDASTGIITTFAGNGSSASTGDGGPATAAGINVPGDLCFDKSWNLYVGDAAGCKVRKINRSGIISTVAGNGNTGLTIGGRADTSALGLVFSICIGPDNLLYISARVSQSIVRINAAGIIELVAGVGTGMAGTYNGDEIPATTAHLDPTWIRFDNLGRLFIDDASNYRVRYIDDTGYIHTAAGNGTNGTSGDGGPATSSQFNGFISGLAFDSCNNLYISESPASGGKIRKVTYDTCIRKLFTENVYVNQHNTRADLTIYPNPTHNELHIEGPNLQSFRLINSIGTVVQQGPLQPGHNNLPTNGLPAGVYIVEVVTGEGVSRGRVMVE